MAIHEQNLNDAIAQVLDGLRPGWRAAAEQSGKMAASAAKRPDIVVRGEGGLAVIIENEFAPARSVEADAQARLGRQLSDGGDAEIVAVLSSPTSLRNSERRDLEAKIRGAEFGYGVYFMEDGERKRFPASGFLPGTIRDFGQFVFRAAIPAQAVNRATIALEQGVQEAAAMMLDSGRRNSRLAPLIAEALKQRHGEQTYRMAATILTNAFAFHENLAGTYQIKSPIQLRDSANHLRRMEVLDEWAKILKINYWPIFDIARAILAALPGGLAQEVLNITIRTAEYLIADQVSRSHDLAGRVFQRLIADRKFLATFYTRPTAATLLAHLAIPEDMPFAGGDWKTGAHKYAMADFACGTGTLLSAAYKRAAELHELNGGDAAKIHGAMMEHALVGCDVMPSAVHLAASMLSGMFPTEKFADTRLYTLPYGSAQEDDYALGSLELLNKQEVFPSLATAPQKIKALGGKEAARQEILWRSMDLVIMNPPFTRPTNHEGRHAEVPNPAFAAFGADAKLQKELGERSKRFRAGTCGSGNAGVASDFVALADKLVKPGGGVALVLPLAALAGDSWKAARALWAGDYEDIRIVSLSAADINACSFSADTGMAEILFVGRKKEKEDRRPARAVFIVLNERPNSEIVGGEIARRIRRALRGGIRKLEDVPYGATDLIVGKTKIGALIDAPLPKEKQEPWPAARIRDLALAQTAHALANGKLWPPNDKRGIDLPIAKLGEIARRGLISRDINGKQPDGSPRGPFDVLRPPGVPVPTFPCLWAHDAKREKQIEVAPDSECVARIGMEAGTHRVWDLASRAHHNVDFQFNAQALAVAMTKEPTIGGRAWPNVIFPNRRFETAFALWANSTLGLLIYWWWSSKVQEGRGSISLLRLPGMPALDVRRLSARQLKAAEKIFAEMKDTPLLPLAEADKDAARKQLDDAFALRVLELDESKIELLDLLRAKLAAEPSVRGSKYN